MNIYLGKNIRHLRKSVGMTQEDLGSHLGVKISAVGKWERDINEPGNESLMILSGLFSVSIDDLLKTDLTARPQVQGNGKGIESTPEVLDEIAELTRRLKAIEENQRTERDLDRHRLAIRKVMKEYPEFGKLLEDEFDL